jgi:hypothetical protein
MPFPRVLFCLRERDNPYGCDPPGAKHLSSGLFNSAKFVSDMLVSLGFVSSVVHVVDNNGIHAAVTKAKADVCVIESLWVVPSKFDELKKVLPKVMFVVRSHSDVPFMANEGCALTWIYGYLPKTNVVVATNSQRALGDLQFLAHNAGGKHNPVVLLPNYYPTASAILGPPRPVGSIVQIGCFGAIRPLKNQLIQAEAALRYGYSVRKNVWFHMNGGRIEQNGSPILKNLMAMFDNSPGNELVLHPWLPHDQFMALTAEMDLVTQVSFSETFNIVAADAVVSGVPVVVSDQITWVNSAYRTSTDDSSAISETMAAAIRHPTGPNLYGLEQYDQRSIVSWLKFLSQF